jgi:hypothetical protein
MWLYTALTPSFKPLVRMQIGDCKVDGLAAGEWR